METFIETSTIHGVSHISTERKFVRIFWTLVVISGFTGAGVLIYQSFQAWADNPVTTTIETLPMENNENIKFPKVTVCPPKNTYTDLNYDLMMTANTSLTDETRYKLKTYAMELLHNYLHRQIMKNLSKLEEDNRYYNWYNGYTKLQPVDPGYNGFDIHYNVLTSATSGSVTTQHFLEKFDPELVETSIHCGVQIFPHRVSGLNKNLTLHINIEKVSLQKNSNEEFYIDYDAINEDINSFSKNFTPPLFSSANTTNALFGALGKRARNTTNHSLLFII